MSIVPPGEKRSMEASNITPDGSVGGSDFFAHLKTVKIEPQRSIKPSSGIVRQDAELCLLAATLLSPSDRATQQGRAHTASSITRQHVDRVDVQGPHGSED